MMKERIQEFINSKGISAGELASLLEVQRSNISHILNGRNKPGASLIERMLLVFPELNARWLLTGEGDMIEDKSSGQTSSVKEPEAKTQKSADIVIEHSKTPSKEKQVDRVVLLFNDGTFISYNK